MCTGTRWILELDDQFNAITLGAGGELQQGMLVETQLSKDAIKADDSAT